MTEKILKLLQNNSRSLHVTEDLDIINGIAWNDFWYVAEQLNELFQRKIKDGQITNEG